MQKQVGEASKESKTLKDVKAFMNEDDVTVVGFFSGEEDAGLAVYLEMGKMSERHHLLL